MSFLRMRVAELEGAINEAVVKEKDGTDKIQIGSEIIILFDGEKAKLSNCSSKRSRYFKK